MDSDSPWGNPNPMEPRVLWNGGDAAGWRQCGPGSFEVVDGALVARGGMGMLWYAEESYADFTLSLEWKVTRPEDNSGIFVRFPDPGGDPWVAVNGGYEIQICDTADDKHNTGSIYSFQGPSKVPTRAVGEWNHMEIFVSGQHYRISVNGLVVNEYVGDRTLEGFIGIQNHDDGSPVHYRNIRVHEHQSATK